MDEWTLQEEAYEKGLRVGKHESAKEIYELKKERDYFRDLSTDLQQSVRGMTLEIKHLRESVAEMCERCPYRDDDEWDE